MTLKNARREKMSEKRRDKFVQQNNKAEMKLFL